MPTKNIMLVGVGGQGTLLASRILGCLLCKKGFDVKMSEVHGMAQRGGSVVTYVRYGDKVHSPIVDPGFADTVLAFERLEALRFVHYLKKNGRIIYNDSRIDPLPVLTGAAAYPEGIYEKLTAAGARVTALDALFLAEQAGNAKAVNVALIGALARESEFSKEDFIAAIKETVPEKLLLVNLRAFELGFEACGG